MSTHTHHIRSFDTWMTEIKSITDIRTKDDLAFKQSNDYLLYQHFPQFVQHAERYEGSGDDRLILEYSNLINKAEFREYSVDTYFEVVEKKLAALPRTTDLRDEPESIQQLCLQNLILVAFTIERWAQFVKREPAGSRVRQIAVGPSKESLHIYLTTYLGNYNTLSSFAMTSVPQVESLLLPSYHSNTCNFETALSYKSYYCDLPLNIIKQNNRFPSVMKLDDFPLVIKKGEMLAQGYNYKLLQLQKHLESGGHLEDEFSVNRAKEITYMFKAGIHLYQEFLKSPHFNEAKFIYILRQHTVELGKSPAALLLEGNTIFEDNKPKIKGLLDHYLVRIRLNVKERLLFIQQILFNENIELPCFDEEVRNWLHLDFSQVYVLAKEYLSTYRSLLQKRSVSALIFELIESEFIGTQRIRYALQAVVRKFPELDEAVKNLQNDSYYLDSIRDRIIMENYALPPSGANSIAYFGPDCVLGHATKIPNYTMHMVNRIPVMVATDQKRIWDFFTIKKGLLPDLVSKQVQLLAQENSEHQLRRAPWLPLYFDLFDSYALLTKTHDGIIEKYIRRLGRNMDNTVKKRLISNPDHGTTYMQPKTSDRPTRPLELPALDQIAIIRKNHPFRNLKKYVKNQEELVDAPFQCVQYNTNIELFSTLNLQPSLV